MAFALNCSTRSSAEVRATKLDWIVGPGYSFGVFSTSRFVPPILSSDCTWPALSLSSVVCRPSSVTDRLRHWRGVPTDWKWWFFVTHRLLYSRGGSNWPFRCLDYNRPLMRSRVKRASTRNDSETQNVVKCWRRSDYALDAQSFKIATILCHWCQVSCTDAHYLLRGVHVCTQGVFVHFHKSSSRAAKIACHRAFKDFHFSENSLLGSLPPLLVISMLSFKRLIQLDAE